MEGDAGALIASAMRRIELKILVFGPQVHTPGHDERTRKLQGKRVQIREYLESEGHYVRYAEDVVDPNIAGPGGNAFFQELLIMEEYDLIVTIVDSPGSIAEATAISMSPKLAQKSALFLDANYVEGLVGAACQNASDIGAHFETYEYPTDLDDCHLLGFVSERASATQKIKFLR